MSDLSPSQLACNHAVEKLAQAIGHINTLAKYQSADSLDAIMSMIRDEIAAASADIARVDGFAAEARQERLKAFG
jgi:hypothetical protein